MDAKDQQEAPSYTSEETRAAVSQLAAQIEDSAPELASMLEDLPSIPPEERGLVEERAKEAARTLAQLPPEKRPAAAAVLESRVDAYKVQAPDGTITWVPLEAVGE